MAEPTAEFGDSVFGGSGVCQVNPFHVGKIGSSASPRSNPIGSRGGAQVELFQRFELAQLVQIPIVHAYARERQAPQIGWLEIPRLW